MRALCPRVPGLVFGSWLVGSVEAVLMMTAHAVTPACCNHVKVGRNMLVFRTAKCEGVRRRECSH